MRHLTVLCAVLIAGCGSGAPPSLRFAEDTPPDLSTLADETFSEIADAFPSRHGCLDGIELAGVWEMDDRASYEPDRRRLNVRIPATAPQLEMSIVHEVAHHLEFACPAQADVRPSFLEAQGFEEGHPWFDGDTWSDTPSEHWASAVVLHVLERIDEHAGITVTPTARTTVREWATGP